MTKLTIVEGGKAAEIRARLEPIVVDVCNVLGSISVLEAAAPNEVAIDAPDFKRASRAIYQDLDNILSRLSKLDVELADAQSVGGAA